MLFTDCGEAGWLTTHCTVVNGYTGVQWALDGRPHTCHNMAWRHIVPCYQGWKI